MADAHPFTLSPIAYGTAFAYAGLIHIAIVAMLMAFSRTTGRMPAAIDAPLTARLETAQPEPISPGSGPARKKASHPKTAAAALQERYKGASTRKVLRRWTGPPAGISRGLSCQLHVKVRADGIVLEVEVGRSSGSEEFDRSAVAAVRAASPLGPPPASAVQDGVYEFELTFDPTR